jgi:hypothetical protein
MRPMNVIEVKLRLGFILLLPRKQLRNSHGSYRCTLRITKARREQARSGTTAGKAIPSRTSIEI